MINLLPQETKQAYLYASANVKLLRWSIAIFLGLIGAGLIATYGLLSVQHAVSTTNQQIVDTKIALSNAKQAETTKKIGDISDSLKLTQKVLSQEILFSKLLKQMAVALPAGAKLTGLNIAQVAGGSGLDVTAEAADTTAATQVQVNLADPANKIFAKADIQGITCNSKNAPDAAYP
jgi:Tfp pilus assembly protein PilN